MDDVTQQNAALVEQITAAATSLEEQAKRMDAEVAVFRLAGQDAGQGPGRALESTPAAPSYVIPEPSTAAAAKRQAPKLEPVAAEGDWEEF